MIGKMTKLDNLDARLKDILQCIVCKLLPKATIFQCPQGHLICTSCFTGILREGPTETPCPQTQCGSLLSKARAARNVAVEKVVQELPADCRFCSQSMPRRIKDVHESDTCPMRPTDCHYRVLGCTWRGPQSEAGAHAAGCPWPRKPGSELMSALRLTDQLALQGRSQCDRVFDLLSSEAIVFEDIQLRRKGSQCPGQDCMESFAFEAFSNTWVVQARINEQSAGSELTYQGCHTYESSMFCAFNNTWVMRMRLNLHTTQPLFTVPEVTYQLMLKSSNELPCEVTFCLLQGPLGDLKVNPVIKKHKFSEENDVSSDVTLSFTDPSFPQNSCSLRFFNFRIFMFLTPKNEQ